MKLKEFGSWPAYNVSGENEKYYGDEFNRSFIKERYKVPDEYASKDVDEYYKTPKMNEAYDSWSEKKEDPSKDDKSRQKKTRDLRQRMLRQVVILAVGSVVVVTSYQSVVAEQQQAINEPSGQISETVQEESPVLTPSNWKWSDDNLSVTVELSDPDGKVIKEVPAEVSVEEEAATCNKEGLKTFTAKVTEDKNTFTDTKTEPIAPLGHSFDEGRQTALGNGKTATTFECTRCHEQFTIETSMTEND